MTSASTIHMTSTTSSSNSRITGAIRKLKEGYGFIAGDDGKDYFFHWSAMERTGKNFRDLAIQERVEFNVVEIHGSSETKWRAVGVRVL
jgi:Cold shock proteins